jgi:hypothetical protein
MTLLRLMPKAVGQNDPENYQLWNWDNSTGISFSDCLYKTDNSYAYGKPDIFRIGSCLIASPNTMHMGSGRKEISGCLSSVCNNLRII